jgi:molybdopterin-containing oxidoreductase family iron-sulfur binding subunit
MTAPDTAPITLHRAAPDGVNRRQAMALMAASTALATSACSRRPDAQIHSFVQGPEARGGELPLYYASAFVRDGYAHGVLIGTKQGRPIKIEGNPLHPASLGATDVFAQASVLQLWDPDRSAVVLQRLQGTTEQLAASSWSAFETAWRLQSARAAARGGDGWHLLSGPVTSPTLRAQIATLRARYPALRWHVHAPACNASEAVGLQAAFGQPLAPLWHFDRARCVLALAADPFRDGPGAVRHAMDWARQRAATGGAAPRLFAVEVAPGLFGARADRRIALPPAAIEALLWRVAARWISGLPAVAPDPRSAVFEAAAMQALQQAGPDALVVGGPALSPPAHALVHALNQRLGAIGRGVHYIAAPDAAPEAGGLAELTQTMQAGTVDTLVMLGSVNPVYDAPAGSDFTAALQRVRFSVHHGLYANETAAHCHWHLPETHDYEQWSDAMAHDGSATLVQPAIAPLYDSRSTHELIALLADDPVRDGHALLRRHWQATQAPRHGSAASAAASTAPAAASAPAPASPTAAAANEMPQPPQAAATIAAARGHVADAETAASAAAAITAEVTPSPFDTFWQTSLQRGVIADSAAPPVTPPAARLPQAGPVPAPPAHALAAVFTLDSAVHDGRYANIGWLQELPRPFTKHTWDNVAMLGPATAQALGVDHGANVTVEVAGRRITAPVWVHPLHAEGAVSLPLGYGRRRAGRVGTAVGFDAYALWPQQGAVATAQLQRAEGGRVFAVTQHAMDRAGREIARTLPLGARIDDPGLQHPSLYPANPNGEHAWAMVIDLDACIGCGACTIACQAENNIPIVGRDEVARGRAMHWIRVDRYDAPELGNNSVFQPVPCMHCEKAPCELVCPVGATVHDEDGLNVQVYNRCVGTRFCSNNCPYKVRRFNFLQYTDNETETLKAQRNPDVTVRRRGVMEKCTYCLQRISRAREHADAEGRPIADGEVVTACQAVCPTRAIHFGDLKHEGSDVVQQRRSPRHYALLGDLNTVPRTTYLARVRKT